MESPPKQPDYINLVGVIVIGAAGALLVYMSFVGLQAFYEVEAQLVEERRNAEGKGDEFRTLWAEQESELQGYRRIDPEGELHTIPIERAMDLVFKAAQASPGAILVPVVGAHDTPTVPAVAGRPPDNAQLPPAAPTPTPAPATGAPTDPAQTPAGGAEAGTGAAATPGAPPAAGTGNNAEGNAPQ